MNLWNILAKNVFVYYPLISFCSFNDCFVQLGDSGGPNYFTDPETSKRTQLGVVSWGIGCAQVGFPGVYTSVAYHYDFIQSAVCEDQRLGDFGVTGSSVYSQSDITAASPLRLCLPDDIPASNNAGGADPVQPIIIGESMNEEENDLGDVPEEPKCFKENTKCESDDDCCGTSICKRRDKVCSKPPRQNKVCISKDVNGKMWHPS